MDQLVIFRIFSLLTTFPFRPDVLILVIIVLVLFLCLLLWKLFTPKRQAINAYRKTVYRSLQKRLKSYHPPSNAIELSEAQGQHVVLVGLPGSGKTKSLEHFLRQATSRALRNTDKIPVLIQMKYYDGFFRQHQPDTQTVTSTETLLAYLLDERQSSKDSELIGIQHLRPYLRKFIEQGRITFLCDGMNELKSEALQSAHDELLQIMQTQNRVIMTCRELEYQEQDVFRDFDQRATRETLPALSENDVPHVVESYLQGQTPAKRRNRKQATISKEQIQDTKEQIRRINQPHRYTSPFMLITLIQALNQLEPRQAQTISRGRLLQISVEQRLAGQENAPEIRRFLSIVACTARCNEQRNAIQLGSKKRPVSIIGLSELLKEWLADNEANDSDYSLSDIRKFLDTAQKVELITISNYGVLSFTHELIAEYFAAEYLFYIYHENRDSDRPFWRSFYESEAKAAGIWSEPVAIWAGLEEQPMEVATFLVQWVENANHRENDEIYYHALALSLACVGVKAPSALPLCIQRYLEKFVCSAAERAKLAKIFKRCADEGGIEVYNALLSLMYIRGLPHLFLELHELRSDKKDDSIPVLLFNYLETMMIQTGDADQALVKVFVSVLGELGKRTFDDTPVRSRAQNLLNDVSRPISLRRAAIGILQFIKNPADVSPLIGYLDDPNRDQLIAGAAISALTFFGPELVLKDIGEQENKRRSPADAQIRLNLLRVLENFLQSLSPIPDQYYRGLISIITRFLTMLDNDTTCQIARNLLHEQIQNPQRLNIVISLLLGSMATPDEKQAKYIQGLLHQNCLAVFESIKNYWRTQAPTEQARARIIEVLGQVANEQILVFLLQQLDDAAPSVQHALCHALTQHRPKSIDPLVEITLTSGTTKNATELAANVLKEIGADSIAPISRELLHIQSYTNAPGFGLYSLVQLIHYFRENALIPAEENENVVRTLITLLPWLIDNIGHVQLAAHVIQVMVGFRNPLVVPPLITLLGKSPTTLNVLYNQAITGLSSLGDIAFNHLIDALNSPQETLTKRVRQVLLGMNPFPDEQLLSTFKDPRDAVVQQVERVFIDNQHMPQTAPFLVSHLLDDGLSYQVKQTIKAMQPKITMPHLVKELNKAGWQPILEPLLLECPEPAITIPLLVDELGDMQRCRFAGEVLLEFDHQLVLPWLIPGLETPNARQRTKWLITQMVSLSHQNNMNLLPHVIQLFDPAAVQPQRSTIPSEARTALRELLTYEELAKISLPALINGLREQPLIEDCSISLEALVRVPDRQDEVLHAVLQALRDPYKQRGAHVTLVRCGQLAAGPVCDLLRDHDTSGEACSILADMGDIAFPFIHKLAHNPQGKFYTKNILMRMDGPVAAKGLLSFLTSNDIEEMEMAFYLLYIRIDDEYRLSRFDMTQAMLRQAQKYNSDMRLRILTALLFFNSNTQTQQRKKIAEHIIDAIARSPEYHAEFMRALLLLGEQAQEPLENVIDAQVSSTVQLEAIGTLGTLVPYSSKITGYMRNIAANTPGHTVSSGRKKTQDFRMLQNMRFRALGGLLLSGLSSSEELAQRQNDCQKIGDFTSSEFYSVLLGERNLPKIEELNKDIQEKKRTIAGLETQIQQDTNTIAKLKNDIKQEQTRKSDAEQRYNTSQTENRALLLRATTAEQRCSALQTDNAALRSGIHQQP